MLVETTFRTVVETKGAYIEFDLPDFGDFRISNRYNAFSQVVLLRASSKVIYDSVQYSCLSSEVGIIWGKNLVSNSLEKVFTMRP